MNHNEEVPDFLEGLGDMLPADVLKKVNELLEQLHRKDKDHQGSTVFIYAPGSQYVDTQINIGKDTHPEPKTHPVPPCVGREKGRNGTNGAAPVISSTSDDERILRCINVMNEEGMLKHLYDYTWVMEVMNQTKDLPMFDTPASFITYMEDLGIKRLPSEDTIIKKKNKFTGTFPDWKFTDCDTTEATRRINVGKRFLSLFRKS